ncbi:MAG: PIG-L deacetylase family protein [Anaerolineales bacterium]
MSKKEYIPKRAMSIQAHPDDQDFSVAGTLARWAKAGCEITCVVITSGDAGSNDPAHGADYKPALAALREAEQTAANEVLGIGETVFLHYPDGELEPTLQLRRELTRLIRRCKPDAVVTGDPETFFYGSEYINHPDHRAAARAACEAVFPSAGTRLIFTDLLAEGLEPHNVKRLYIQGKKPDTWVDIGETIDLKIAALRKHASQIGDWDVDKQMRAWAKATGKKKKLKYAEAFKVMILAQDEEEK